MKNGIIIFLALVLGYFVLSSLGTFQFGSLIERDYREYFAKQRTRAVQHSPVFKLGVVCNREDGPTVACMQGIDLAIEEINRNGGILGKPIEVQYIDSALNGPDHNAAAQTFCEKLDVAACIGPFNSDYIPSMRAITHYQGLPLISPLTVRSEKLPPLSHDNYFTLFPPLELWANALIDDMERRQYKNILLIGPGGNTYGDIFCTAIERESKKKSTFQSIYRINYQPPLRQANLARILGNYTGNRSFDAVFFGGTYPDYLELVKLIHSMKIQLLIYGSDDLDVPQLYESPKNLPANLFIPQAILPEINDDFSAAWQKKYDTPPTYPAIFGANTIYAIQNAVTKNKSYSPDSLLSSLNSTKIQSKITIKNLSPENGGETKTF